MLSKYTTLLPLKGDTLFMGIGQSPKCNFYHQILFMYISICSEPNKLWWFHERNYCIYLCCWAKCLLCSTFYHLNYHITYIYCIDFYLLTEPVIEKTLRASITEVSVLLLFSDDMDVNNSSVPISELDDMRNSQMFSSCLSSEQFEKSVISPATASSLNMHHLEAKCQNIHLDLQVFIFCLC